MSNILRLPEVKARTRLSRSTLYRLMRRKENPFPHPIKLTSLAIGWLETEVDGWVSARMAERPSQPSQAVPVSVKPSDTADLEHIADEILGERARPPRARPQHHPPKAGVLEAATRRKAVEHLGDGAGPAK
jgi:prophage regulatory protein